MVEIVIVAGLFGLLMLAAYRLFFAEVRAIKTALEHISINESARRLFANLGNDIRNSNWVEYPLQTNRQTVKALLPVNEGKLCVLRRQVFDFSVKPPDTGFIQEEEIEYYLKKAEDGTSDLFRKVTPIRGMPGKKAFEKKICEGIREMLLFTTNKKTVTMNNFSATMPFKGFITYEPYEHDGTGPYLVNVMAAFVRKGKHPHLEDRVAFRVRTSFCIRGRLNGVHP